MPELNKSRFSGVGVILGSHAIGLNEEQLKAFEEELTQVVRSWNASYVEMGVSDRAEKDRAFESAVKHIVSKHLGCDFDKILLEFDPGAGELRISLEVPGISTRVDLSLRA